jgi:DNA-binding NarL/FixJ family response regulator
VSQSTDAAESQRPLSAAQTAELIRENQRLRAELDATLAQLADLRERFALLARASAEPDPRPGLREIAALSRRLRELEADQVQAALARGFSYAEIAAELGITRQSVHQKHARRAGAARSGERG